MIITRTSAFLASKGCGLHVDRVPPGMSLGLTTTSGRSLGVNEIVLSGTIDSISSVLYNLTYNLYTSLRHVFVGAKLDLVIVYHDKLTHLYDPEDLLVFRAGVVLIPHGEYLSAGVAPGKPWIPAHASSIRFV